MKPSNGASEANSDSKPDATHDLEIISIPLHPLAMDLPECRVAIKEVNSQEPDESDNLTVTVKYIVSNDSKGDWEHLDARVQILDATGCVVDESGNIEEQTIIAGESAEFEVVLWSVNAKLLGVEPEKAHFVVSVVASRNSQINLGEYAIPVKPYTSIPLKKTKVGDILSVVSGSLWKTEPDDDKEVRIELKLLMQNLTSKYFPQVTLDANVLDKNGGDLIDLSGNYEAHPGQIFVISSVGYGKDKKTVGARASLSIRAYFPVAAGTRQQQGMKIKIQSGSEFALIDADSKDFDMGNLDMLVSEIVTAFKEDPRNKVYVDFPVLLLSAIMETGNKTINAKKLVDVIKGYTDGDLDGDATEIYDGAIAVCGSVARQCFADNEDEDVDYELSWFEACHYTQPQHRHVTY